MSYGTYQLSSKYEGEPAGTVKNFLYSPEGRGYRRGFAGTTPGTPDFSEQWRSAAKADPEGLHQAEKEYIYRTHYLPAAGKAVDAGLDMSNPAAQEAVWSGSIQHGAGSGGFPNAVSSAVANNPGFSGMSTEDQLKAIYWARSNQTKAWNAGGGRYFGRPQEQQGEFSVIRDINAAYQGRAGRKP